MEERHLSLVEACEALGISERTAYRWIKSGKLKAYKPGRDYWIPESAIRLVVEESEVRPKAESRSSLEPKLFNGLEGEQRKHEFGDARDGLNGFCDYWEERLAGGDISRREFDDLGATVTGWIPVLKEAMAAEWNEILISGKRNHNSDLYGTGSEILSLMVLSPPMNRFMALGGRLAQAEHEMYGEDMEAEKRRGSFEVLEGMRNTA
jgi:excisionase family DNA binding protein